MTIMLITGSYPPDVCGVGDYTYNLKNTPTAQDWMLFYTKNWKLFSFFQKVRQINASGADIIIMESPTQGYGWSLLPHILTVWFGLFSSKKMVVRLHEYTQLSVKSRLAVKLMLLTTNFAIFTNDYDRSVACSHFKRLKKRSAVVKIFSNISKIEPAKSMDEREIDIVNFGHIRPGKGIESFIETAERLRAKRPQLRVVLAGQVPEGYESYFASIEPICQKIGVRLVLNAPSVQIAELLNNSKVAYLPFPDGVSERRGSMLAALANGAVVMTTGGGFTTEKLAKAVKIITADDACKVLAQMLGDAQMLAEQQKKGFEFLEQEIPHSWDDVAGQYIKVINQ